MSAFRVLLHLIYVAAYCSLTGFNIQAVNGCASDFVDYEMYRIDRLTLERFCHS